MPFQDKDKTSTTGKEKTLTQQPRVLLKKVQPSVSPGKEWKEGDYTDRLNLMLGVRATAV